MARGMIDNTIEYYTIITTIKHSKWDEEGDTSYVPYDTFSHSLAGQRV